MVEIIKIADATSWKSKRRSWIWKVEEVGVYESITSGKIYML